jgi:hypothetical protein
VDYSGQEKLFGKFTCAQTVRDTRASLGHGLCKTRVNSADYSKEKQDRSRPSSDRSASGANRPVVEKPEKHEGDGFGEMHF